MNFITKCCVCGSQFAKPYDNLIQYFTKAKKDRIDLKCSKCGLDNTITALHSGLLYIKPTN